MNGFNNSSMLSNTGSRLLTGRYDDIRNSQDNLADMKAKLDRYRTFGMTNINNNNNNTNYSNPMILDQSTRMNNSTMGQQVPYNDLSKIWNLNDTTNILNNSMKHNNSMSQSNNNQI